ncbi:DUF397 domain-containing protein [Streptomyces sp. URMC 129]|uniref:DUF397 domain-containing protein n=1 Tax=Streptomyces sp. URMC 129 TaxID=3423407 RepID=UPI003F197066
MKTISEASTLTAWRKSSYSGVENANCLEVADRYPAGVPVRDSKCSDGPALVFPATGWAAFVSAVSDATL